MSGTQGAGRASLRAPARRAPSGAPERMPAPLQNLSSVHGTFTRRVHFAVPSWANAT